MYYQNNIKTKNIMKIETTHVFRVNGDLVVATNIENAIRSYKEKHPFPASVDTVERIFNNDSTDNAIMESVIGEVFYKQLLRDFVVAIEHNDESAIKQLVTVFKEESEKI